MYIYISLSVTRNALKVFHGFLLLAGNINTRDVGGNGKETLTDTLQPNTGK